MVKVAKLVTISLVTRVIVEEGTKDEAILAEAKPWFLDKIVNNELLDNLESIVDDEECPYSPEDDELPQFSISRETVCRKLGDLISDDDHTTEEALKLLEEQSLIDGSVMADDVLCMWEKVEFTYTVDQLLDEIDYHKIKNHG